MKALQKNLAEGLAALNGLHPAVRGEALLVNLEAGSGTLILRATDHTVSVVARVPCTADESEVGMAVTVRADLLGDFVRAMEPTQEIRLDMDEKDRLVLRAAGHRATLKGAALAVTLPEMEGELVARVNAALLRKAIGRVAYAAADRDSSRPAMTGVYLRLDGNKAVLAAADGFRLAVQDLAVECLLEEAVQAIIPGRGMELLAHVLGGEDETVGLELVPAADGQYNLALFQSGSVDLAITLLGGVRYPDYEQVIPKESNVQITVNAEELRRVLKVIAPFAEEDRPHHPMRLTLDNGEVTVQAGSSAYAEGQGVIPVRHQGPGAVVGLNARYLWEALAGASGEITVELLCPGNGSGRPSMVSRPVTIRGAKDGWLAVVMPVVEEERPAGSALAARSAGPAAAVAPVPAVAVA